MAYNAFSAHGVTDNWGIIRRTTELAIQARPKSLGWKRFLRKLWTLCLSLATFVRDIRMLRTLAFFIFLYAPAAFAAAPVYTVPVLDLEGDTICSAALLSPTTALTAAHCVDSAFAPVLMKCGKEFTFGLVTKYSVEDDLAVVDTFMPCEAATVLKVAEKDPDEGTDILVQGHPGGGPRTTTAGVVSRYDYIVWPRLPPRYVMISDATVSGGNSGGPAIINGTLAGICQAKLCLNSPAGIVPSCYSIFAPPSLIRKFLAQE